MFISLEKEDLDKFKEYQLSFISSWENIDIAKKYYNNITGLFVGYKCQNPTYAYKTPVKVFEVLL